MIHLLAGQAILKRLNLFYKGQKMIIEFEITKDEYTFRDAIVLQDGENLTDKQIEEMKQARFDAWYAIVTAPQEKETGAIDG